MSLKKFYITTAIDYVNSLPHVGTAYEKIGADVLARWYRLNGYDVHFQMGNDEHSVNVEKAAKAQGKTPKVYCDEMRTHFEKIWKSLNISNDGFIQTSDEHHKKGVQKIVKKVMEKGDIYRKLYEGWYCESCEAFLTEKDLVDGMCPNHKSKPKWLSEENYFFSLSKYQEQLLKHIDKNSYFILPEMRKNEIVNFIKEGLQDISISRSSFEWGIPMPDDPEHVVYVWFDALSNYITAVGYGWDEKLFKKWWPADMHVIGKDITRFHCIIWPAMLMSADIPLPQTIFGHGFVYLKGEKMSKTLGNVVTPMDVIEKVGSDPLRYYLMREGSFGRDGDFTWEHFTARYNGDLANGIGNLVSRTIGMAVRYQDGMITPVKMIDTTTELFKISKALAEKIAKALDHTNGDIEFHNALASIWEVIATADRHINDHKPWEMAKIGEKGEINNVLWEVSSAIRMIAILLGPFIPETSAKIWDVMGFDALGPFDKQTINDVKNPLNKPITVKSIEGMFPRIDSRHSERSEESGFKKSKKQDSSVASLSQNDTEKEPKKVETKIEPKVEQNNLIDLIDISDFAKINLRVAEIKSAEKVEGADKLLKLQVSLGNEDRQIVAGIAKHYTPEELVGKRVIVVTNLKPVKLRGAESHGMLLAASDENTVSILTPLKDVAVGSKVK